MIRKLLIPSLATALAAALLGGCVSGYQYRDGAGDYYYGQPQVEYRDYGYGRYGGYGGGPYGYGSGWGGQIGYGYGGYGSSYGYGGYGGYGSPYGYGGYGYPYYPGGPVIIVHRGDRDWDDDGDADDRIRLNSNGVGVGGGVGTLQVPIRPTRHLVDPPASFPSESIPLRVMPVRPMRSDGIPSMPRIQQPQGAQSRHDEQDHDAGRSLIP